VLSFVLKLCQNPKMIGINTISTLASMMQIETRRNWADEQLKNKLMSDNTVAAEI
jgi:hypothetical protein